MFSLTCFHSYGPSIYVNSSDDDSNILEFVFKPLTVKATILNKLKINIYFIYYFASVEFKIFILFILYILFIFFIIYKNFFILYNKR
jgi:hypothetical protein